MRLIGCDLHASQQSVAMLDRDTGVVVEKTLKHEGQAVREFYTSIPPPVVVGIEVVRSWTLAFFDASLRGQKALLLQNESPREFVAAVLRFRPEKKPW
jgi:hypothetical protein